MSVADSVALAVGNNPYVEHGWGEMVSGNFFDVLKVRPELGPFFDRAESDDAQNAHPVVVISHPYWTSHYHADPHVIGTTVRIDQLPYTIIGVAPETFHGSMPVFPLTCGYRPPCLAN